MLCKQGCTQLAWASYSMGVIFSATTPWGLTPGTERIVEGAEVLASIDVPHKGLYLNLLSTSRSNGDLNRVGLAL